MSTPAALLPSPSPSPSSLPTASSSTYLANNKLIDDGDDQRSRQLGNRSIFDYVLNLDVPRHRSVDVDFQTSNTNLFVRDGYGVCDASVIDTDSKLRLDSSVTHTRSKFPLVTRAFVANPLVHTSASTLYYSDNQPTDSRHSLESSHQQQHQHQQQPLPLPERDVGALSSESTRGNGECWKGDSAETSFFEKYTRTPLVPSMQAFVSADVPDVGFVSIGQPSRDLLKRGQLMPSRTSRLSSGGVTPRSPDWRGGSPPGPLSSTVF